MKKYRILILILVLALCLCGCRKGNAPSADDTFADNTRICGVNVSAMTADEAWTAVKAAADSYTLAVDADGVAISLTGKDVELTCSEAIFRTAADAVLDGKTPDWTNLITFHEGKLQALLERSAGTAAVDAAITYDQGAAAFVLTPHTDGLEIDPQTLMPPVSDAIRNLQPTLALTGVCRLTPAGVTGEALQPMVDKANKMLGTELNYTFTTEEETEETVTVPREKLLSFILLDPEKGPVVDRDALGVYVAELSQTYSLEGTTGSFVTSGGSRLNMQVSYDGYFVDAQALVEDMAACIEAGTSGTRPAPYQPSGDRTMAYGGSYVEVDLTSQKLWLYKDGSLILSTPLVSGNVNEGMRTPTGIYSIYAKSTDAVLTGEDYSTPVDYWMPFHGGYGLHDANWRGSFGGELYLYGGSHGCVNLPPKAAATIFNNVSVGTKVILYGGKTSVPPLEQELSGSSAFSVADDAGSFSLNVKAKHEGGQLTYTSDNTKVATVDETGKVTVLGIGKANITVTAPERQGYTKAVLVVEIHVHSACEEGRHTLGEPQITQAPTCQSGIQTVTCTKCGMVTQTELAPVQSHTFGQWTVVQQPTCGAEGSQERVCTLCGKEKETQSIPATGQHTPGQWSVAKEATCTENGSRVQRCSQCDTVLQTEIIPADPQAHTPGPWQTVTDATCTEEGLQERKCIHCQILLEQAAIPAKGHSFTGGQTCDRCPEPNPNAANPTTEPPDPVTEPTEGGEPAEG